MTEYSIGAREQIAWVEEQGGYKTLGTNTMADDGEIVGYNCTISPQFNRNWQEILNSGADTPEVKDMVLGHKTINFTLSFVPYNWRFLKYCTHVGVTNVDRTTYKEHVWSVGNAIKSFTLEWAKRIGTNQVLTLSGCTIKDFTLKFQKGTGPTEGMVMVEANCVASDYSAGTSITTISAPTAKPLLFFNTKFTFNTTEIVEVNSGEIRFNNGINEDDSKYCNDTYSDTLAEPIPTIKRYGATLNINQKDSSYFTAWSNGVVLPGTNKIRFYKSQRDWVEFSFTNGRLGVAPVSPTNLSGPNKLDLVIVPTTIAITGEDANTY